MDRKIYGIFVAGGSGTRMGAELPKQFLRLGGIPILQRTISSFLEAIPELHVVTVLPKAHFDLWKTICMETDFNVPQQLVAGGITRFHSVQNALAKLPEDAVVLIHDGVRPFVSGELVKSLVQSVKPGTGAIPVVPVVDTLRNRDGSMPDPDRSSIVAVQTPQVFISDDIRKAYSQPYQTSFTDDASVAMTSGLDVLQLPGERYNIKITTPEDMEIAEFILNRVRS